ncbi:MAG: DUF559 domain-containing protein [Thiolinea sp.]
MRIFLNIRPAVLYPPSPTLPPQGGKGVLSVFFVCGVIFSDTAFMEINYNELHRDLSRTLRKRLTPAEQHLWAYLRKKQLKGYRFRRQHPLGRYIVDFVCLEKRLVIELDGLSHQDQQAYDRVRDDWIIQQRFQILRFQNSQVEKQTEQVLQIILNALEELPKRKK